MNKLATFHISCFATYPAECELPDEYFNEYGELIVDARTVIRYLEDNLSSINSVGDLEWIDDASDDPIYSADIIVNNKLKYTVDLNNKTREYVTNDDIVFFKKLNEEFSADEFSGYCGEFFDDSYSNEEKIKAIKPFLTRLQEIASDYLCDNLDDNEQEVTHD